MAANVSDVFNSKRQLEGVPHTNVRNYERCSTAPGHLFQESFDSSEFAQVERRRASRRASRRARSLTPGLLRETDGEVVESLTRLDGMELAMQRNKLLRKAMGVQERGVSSIAKLREQTAEDEKLAREAACAAAVAAREAREREWAAYKPAVLPGIPVRDFPRTPATGVVDGDLGWGRYMHPQKERPASRAEDFYANDQAARRRFFDSFGAHVDDMIDPRFDMKSGRRRLERAQFVEDNFTARRRFIEECLQRKVGPLPVLLAEAPAGPDRAPDRAAAAAAAEGAPPGSDGHRSDSATEHGSGGEGVTIDLTNYRLGDNVTAALAEVLRMREDNHIRALLLANNMIHGLPGELQGGDPDPSRCGNPFRALHGTLVGFGFPRIDRNLPYVPRSTAHTHCSELWVVGGVVGWDFIFVREYTAAASTPAAFSTSTRATPGSGSISARASCAATRRPRGFALPSSLSPRSSRITYRCAIPFKTPRAHCMDN